MEYESVESKLSKASRKPDAHGFDRQQTPTTASVHRVLQLQRTQGNRAMQRKIQTELEINHPEEAYERKADAVAQRIVATPISNTQHGVQQKTISDRAEAKEKSPQKKLIAESPTPHVRRQPLTSPEPPLPTGGNTTQASPVARPDLSALRTIADVAINAEYQSGARDGLSDFESIVGSAWTPAQ